MKPGKKQQVIMSLINAVGDNNKERIQSFFAEGSKVKAADGSEIIGQEAIWAQISEVHDQAEQIDWQVDKLQENEEGGVETEGRVRYLIGNQWEEFEMNGMFEVNGSKVTQWR